MCFPNKESPDYERSPFYGIPAEYFDKKSIVWQSGQIETITLMDVAALILAAGKGTRLNSSLPNRSIDWRPPDAGWSSTPPRLPEHAVLLPL